MHDCRRLMLFFLPIVLWHALSVRAEPLEVADEAGVLDLRLAREEEVPADGHVVRARRDDLKAAAAIPTLPPRQTAR